MEWKHIKVPSLSKMTRDEFLRRGSSSSMDVVVNLGGTSEELPCAAAEEEERKTPVWEEKLKVYVC